jgi:(2Fe-2S) ferredoxin
VTPRKYRIVVCRGPECGDKRNSAALHKELEREIAARGLGPRCELGWQSCFGRCRHGPNVLVRLAPSEHERSSFLGAIATLPTGGQNAALYNGLIPSDVPKIIESHVVNGSIVRELVLRPDAPPRFGETHEKG